MSSDLDNLSNLSMPEEAKPLTDEELRKRTGGHVISAGEEIHLSQLDYSLKKMLIGAGWDVPGLDPAGVDVDLSVFLLNKNDETREDSDFVFYNNVTGCNGAVNHTGDNRTGAGEGDDERIFCDLNEIPFDVMKIVVVASIYEADMRDQYIGMLRNAYVRLINQETNLEILRYNISELSDNKLVYAMRVAEIVREGPVWLFRAVSEPVEGGLGKIATKYGIMVTG